MLDTGAQNSLLLNVDGSITDKYTCVRRDTGAKPYSWTIQRRVDSGLGLITHSFLVIAESPYPLLGSDLLTKMKVQIFFF